jgi:rhodanese-related sulfurtransferase
MFGIFKAAAAGMTCAEAVRLAGAGQLVLIDVRNADEIARSGIARGALHIPLSDLSKSADPYDSQSYRREFGSGRPIAIYCASGARSGAAAKELRRLGHAEVHNIGRFSDWVAAGGPLA